MKLTSVCAYLKCAKIRVFISLDIQKFAKNKCAAAHSVKIFFEKDYSIRRIIGSVIPVFARIKVRSAAVFAFIGFVFGS